MPQISPLSGPTFQPFSAISPTILFQPPNGVGLGHISRLAAIAVAVKQRAPRARTPFLVEGGDHQLLQSMKLPFLTVPHRSEFKKSSWAAWNDTERKSISRYLAESTLEALMPQMVVFDCIPLKPIIRAAVARSIPLVMCIRKVGDPAKYFTDLLGMERYFDSFIVPHTSEEFPVPPPFLAKCRFVGRIVRPGAIRPAAPTENGAKRVLICGGAGGFPGTVEFYNMAQVAVAECRTRIPALETTLITGPLFRDWRNLNMIDGIRVIPFEPEMASAYASSDLVICQAGYNTVSELLQLGTPCICVPAPTVLDSQFHRATEAAGTSPHFHILENANSSELSAKMVDALLLDTPRPVIGELSSPGAGLAAEALLHIIANQSR